LRVVGSGAEYAAAVDCAAAGSRIDGRFDTHINGTTMNPNARVVRCQEMLEADVNGEIVALNVERGQCYGLNSVATEIWRMLEEPTSVDEICGTLTSDYDVDAATCHSEVLALLSQLEDEGLVKTVDG
jgi:hypothetical protein